MDGILQQFLQKSLSFKTLCTALLLRERFLDMNRKLNKRKLNWWSARLGPRFESRPMFEFYSWNLKFISLFLSLSFSLTWDLQANATWCFIVCKFSENRHITVAVWYNNAYLVARLPWIKSFNYRDTLITARDVLSYQTSYHSDIHTNCDKLL